MAVDLMERNTQEEEFADRMAVVTSVLKNVCEREDERERKCRIRVKEEKSELSLC